MKWMLKNIGLIALAVCILAAGKFFDDFTTKLNQVANIEACSGLNGSSMPLTEAAALIPLSVTVLPVRSHPRPIAKPKATKSL